MRNHTLSEWLWPASGPCGSLFQAAPQPHWAKFRRCWLFLPLLFAGLACEPQQQSKTSPPPKATDAPKSEPPKPAEAKRIPVGKNVELEILSDGTRRVRFPALVCFNEGLLELLLCRRNTKEHEAILSAEVDARDIHAALLAAGAEAGSPVKFVPKYQPAKGSKIKVLVEYEKDGKRVTVRAQEWVRHIPTKKELKYDWVFGGSFFYAAADDDPKDPKKPKQYAANGGDVICVSNFETAMLDLPVESSADGEELQFEVFPDRVPALGTKVTVILEPVPEKKSAERAAGKK